jgi:hypothetical protein
VRCRTSACASSSRAKMSATGRLVIGALESNRSCAAIMALQRRDYPDATRPRSTPDPSRADQPG